MVVEVDFVFDCYYYFVFVLVVIGYCFGWEDVDGFVDWFDWYLGVGGDVED